MKPSKEGFFLFVGLLINPNSVRWNHKELNMAEQAPLTEEQEARAIEDAEQLMKDPEFRDGMLRQMARVREMIPGDIEAFQAERRDN